MVKSFQKEFGLDPERKKLMKGLKDFEITHVQINKSRKLYEQKDKENKVLKDTIDIAHFDVIFINDDNTVINAEYTKGNTAKFYSPNVPIIQACKDMLALDGTKDKDGKLKENFSIEEVVEGGEKGKEYLAFA